MRTPWYVQGVLLGLATGQALGVVLWDLAGPATLVLAAACTVAAVWRGRALP